MMLRVFAGPKCDTRDDGELAGGDSASLRI